MVGLLPEEAAAARGERQLLLHSRALQEEVRIVYFADGRYLPEGLDAAKRIFRDRRNDAQVEIDPQLLDLLWAVQRRLAPAASMEVVCGYRSPETNAQLRRERRGVASNSYHMYGQAVDLRIPSCPLRTLHRVATGLEAGGVGYYPRSNFVHLDTGPPRAWGQGRATAATRRAPPRVGAKGGRKAPAASRKAPARPRVATRSRPTPKA
jgi:uncharacterized protein YcbK (DUF882 family)